MQTFIPLSDFSQSARVLDRQRLGKQRVECLQIYNALTGKSKGWVNHPATKMWRGRLEALCVYTKAMTDEWTRRGYQNNIHLPQPIGDYLKPDWLGDERVHSSHRSALLFKAPLSYCVYGWKEKPELNYYWPVN